MPATKKDISEWFDDGLKNGKRWMVITCDTFDYEDFPKYASSEFDLRMAMSPKEMQRVMEVYDLTVDKDVQLNTVRNMLLPPGFT